jgi:aminoglycoside phosphotransferase (APT) family kinase protein
MTAMQFRNLITQPGYQRGERSFRTAANRPETGTGRGAAGSGAKLWSMSAADLPSLLGSNADGLSRLALRLGIATPRIVRRLRGGAACDVLSLEFGRGGRTESAVLKVFPAHMSASAAFEWAALSAAEATPVPTPEPVAFDQSGDWFGTPGIVMSLMPGVPVWDPADVAEWTRQLASTLIAIHQARPRQVPESMKRSAIWDRWTPTGLPEPTAKGVRLALGRLDAGDWEHGLCHGDFHPGNILFAGGAVTGVVDWISARWGPTLSDVGRCRCALAVWPGGDAPDLLLEHYRAATTGSLAGLDYWDALSGAVTAEVRGGRVEVFRELGVAIDEELIQARAVAFMKGALRRARLL